MSIAYRNAERYPDPTVFQALTNIENEEKAQRRSRRKQQQHRRRRILKESTADSCHGTR